MPLKKLQFAPDDKQATASGAEGQWIDGDNVRFRTGLPEKIGLEQLTVAQKELPGVARAQHAFTSLLRKDTAIGISRFVPILW